MLRKLQLYVVVVVVVVVLFITFQERWMAWGILHACYNILDDALSSNQSNLICQVASKFKIVVDIPRSLNQWNVRAMALVHLGCTLPLMPASAITLLVCRGVGGCLCPNSVCMILMYTTLRAIMYSPANSALVADNMTFLSMCAMLSTARLFGGTVVSLVSTGSAAWFGLT